MIKDENLITEAYEATVRAVFTAFHASRISGVKDSKGVPIDPEQIFRDGVAEARKSRDHAIAILKAMPEG